MAKEDLIPLKNRPPEEQRAICRKGGINSGKTRRRKKELKELLTIALSLVDSETDMSNAEMLVASMINKAIAGDVKAATFVRDTAGQKPVEQVEVLKNNINIVIGEEEDEHQSETE